MLIPRTTATKVSVMVIVWLGKMLVSVPVPPSPPIREGRMSDGWEETAALRYVERAENYLRDTVLVIVLQQRWRKLMGVGLVHSRSYDYEWRDVPTVMEEGE